MNGHQSVLNRFKPAEAWFLIIYLNFVSSPHIDSLSNCLCIGTHGLIVLIVVYIYNSYGMSVINAVTSTKLSNWVEIFLNLFIK